MSLELDWDSDMVSCPECNAAQGDLWEHEFGSREEIKTYCGECGKEYVLHLRVTHKYAASPHKSVANSRNDSERNER